MGLGFVQEVLLQSGLLLLELVLSVCGVPPLSLLSSVTAQFKRFFDCGRALRCLLPVASGRFSASSCSVWLSGC